MGTPDPKPSPEAERVKRAFASFRQDIRNDRVTGLSFERVREALEGADVPLKVRRNAEARLRFLDAMTREQLEVRKAMRAAEPSPPEAGP